MFPRCTRRRVGPTGTRIARPNRGQSVAVDRGTAQDRPRRISVVGATGSGKTHLSRLASERLHLPLYELDSLRRDSAGREIVLDQFADAVASLAGGEEWIIDGHYRDVRHLIWGKADTVLWLNYPLSVVAAHLFRRVSRKKGSGTAAEAKSAGPKASWRRRFERISKTLRERREYGRVLRGPELAHVTVVELKSPDAAEEWLGRYST